jgi:nucleoside-diphosphate-sugar epimerase
MGGMKVDRPLPAGEVQHAVQTAGDIWGDLKGRTLLVTGATGFFGRWLLESLLAADERNNLSVSVVALSRNPAVFLARVPHLSDPRIRWLTGSVTTLLPDMLDGQHLDAVVHLATEADMKLSADDPEAAASVIVEGTRRVLGVAKALGARRLLFTSSGAAYGSQPPEMEMIPESYRGIPDLGAKSNPYGVTGEAKRQAELLLGEGARQDGLCAVVARCFSFAGPALPLGSKFAFGNFMQNALEGSPIVIKGDGTPLRSYLYGADLAAWLWTLLLRGAPGSRYNVGSERPINIRGLAETVAREMGGTVDVRGTAAPGDVPDRYVPSTKLARDEFGLGEHFSLPEMILRTAAWHRSNGKH